MQFGPQRPPWASPVQQQQQHPDSLPPMPAYGAVNYNFQEKDDANVELAPLTGPAGSSGFIPQQLAGRKAGGYMELRSSSELTHPVYRQPPTIPSRAPGHTYSPPAYGDADAESVYSRPSSPISPAEPARRYLSVLISGRKMPS